MEDNRGRSGEDGEWIVEVGSEESTVRATIRGIAAIKGVDEADLEPLYDSIEIDALGDLVRHADEHNSSVRIEFTYEEFTIRIDSDEGIRVGDYTPDLTVTERQ